MRNSDAMSRRLLSFFRAEPLKNEGSLARDLLASERTFLAWTRTGLALIGIGAAMEKLEAFASLSPTLLHLESSNTKIAAGVLVASGSGCVAHGTHRYFSTMRDLQRGMFRPNVPGITLLAVTGIGIAFAGSMLVLENDGGRTHEKKDLEKRA